MDNVANLEVSPGTDQQLYLLAFSVELEPLRRAARHSECHDHADQEHGVGGHQAGGVVGAGALAVQQSEARDQHVGADNPEGVQTVSCKYNLCFWDIYIFL